MVDVPEVDRQPVNTDLIIPNLNPHIGPRPLTDISMLYDPGRYGNFSATVSSEFLVALMSPRPRPHFAGIHLFLINDDIAAVSWCAALNEIYGEKGRFVEVSAGMNFHREAFLKGALLHPERGTIEVDSFRVLWELDKLQERHDLRQRGIWRVEVQGLNDGEPISILSLEGEYFRLKPVAHA
jgi:hypothetical protein